MALFGGWAQKLNDFGTGLQAAQASWDGDFQTSAGLMGGMARARETAKKERDAQAKQAQLTASLKAQGLTDEQAALVLNNAGSIGDFRPKTPEPPAFVKNLEAWQQMDPQKRQEVAQMQSVLQPGWMTGQDGLPYQRGPAQVPQPAPWQQNPNEWEMVPGPQQGGGAGNGAGGFPSSRIPSGSPLQRPYRR